MNTSEYQVPTEEVDDGAVLAAVAESGYRTAGAS